MTPVRTDPVTSAVGEAASAAGYRRHRNTWHCENEETVLLINVQKSQHGQQFFVNLGVIVKALGERSSPSASNSHLQWRLEEFMPDAQRDDLAAALDLERSLDGARRSAVLRSALATYGLPRLEDMSTMDRLRSELKRDPQVRAHAMAKLKRFMAMP